MSLKFTVLYVMIFKCTVLYMFEMWLRDLFKSCQLQEIISLLMIGCQLNSITVLHSMNVKMYLQ